MEEISLTICLGSACHTKGSSKMIENIRNWLAINDREENVNFSGSLCCGNCRDGINMTINGKQYSKVLPETLEHFLDTELKPLLEG